MAGHARLIAAIALAVLLAHATGLALLRQQMQQASQPRVLQPMAAPLFTRLLRPQAPPAGALPAPAPAARRVPTARHRASPSAPTSTVTATATATKPMPTLAPATPAIEPAQGVAQAASGSAPTASPSPTPTLEAKPAPQPMLPGAPPDTPPAAEPVQDSWPADTRLSYRLSGHFRGDLHGDAQVQWQRRGGRYEVRVDIDVGLLARLAMTSQGLVTPQGLQPGAYEEQTRSRTRGVRLGPDTITFADGRAVPRPEGVQDTASQFVELAHRFATGQSVLEVGRSVQFWMSRPGAVDLWTYDIVATETLHTPRLGAVQAWHLKPRPLANPRGNITAEMWFAPSLRHLPVRIRINMGDAVFVDLLVDKIEQR